MKHDGDIPNFIISSSTLKKFAFTVALEDFVFTYIDYTVIITTPNLQCLRITADVLGEFKLHGVHSVNEVKLEILYREWAQGDPNHVVWLLEGVTATKSLTVSAGIVSVSMPNIVHYKTYDVY